jgi:predicted nucleic acid-binding protein
MRKGKMNCFVDTNLLIYAIDPDDLEKRQRVKDFLKRIINRHTLVLSPQSLNELYRVVAEKRDLVPRDEARRLVFAWSPFCTAPYDFDVTQQAWRIQDRHRYGWWDCMLLASALLAGCDLFLSEDMQHEHSVGALTIVSPFKLQPSSPLFK